MSNAAASVLGHHCNLRDRVSPVTGIVVNIFNCSQGAKLQTELVDPNDGGGVSA